MSAKRVQERPPDREMDLSSAGSPAPSAITSRRLTALGEAAGLLGRLVPTSLPAVCLTKHAGGGIMTFFTRTLQSRRRSRWFH